MKNGTTVHDVSFISDDGILEVKKILHKIRPLKTGTNIMWEQNDGDGLYDRYKDVLSENEIHFMSSFVPWECDEIISIEIVEINILEILL